MVQARKVQYECISKLTPQEMISRGTQFFADADRRRSSNPPPNLPLQPQRKTCHASQARSVPVSSITPHWLCRVAFWCRSAPVDYRILMGCAHIPWRD